MILRSSIVTRCAGFALNILLLHAFASAIYAADSLLILPSEISLSGPHARQLLLLEEVRDGDIVGQVGGDVKWTTSDAKVVKIEEGRALPVGNGQATITAESGNRKATATVKVMGLDKPFQWSFRNHVESVLAKTGCSSGACHGAQAGKAGFKLSLRGYDPEGDYSTITRQARGRRIVPSDPGRSLLLTKPSGAVPHKGGLRFQPGSREYQVLAEWIAAGTPEPQASDARLERLEILPAGVVLKPNQRQQFMVLAHFSDGHREDVTQWAKYTSTNESVAQVNDIAQTGVGQTGGEIGEVKIVGHGEGAISAWYLSKVVIATVTVPFAKPVAAEVFAKAQRRNFIDDLVLEKLENLNIPPSPSATDAEFIRRAFIDTIGVLPTADETRAFLADTSADKRDKLIDHLLARPEFVDYWSYKWADLLLVNSDKLKPGAGNSKSVAMWSYYSWIRNQVEANTPWDEMVRELITVQGSALENGAGNYFVLHKDPLDLAETTTVAFLGMSINCARCHNHPLEKWTNNQYYGFANLFARVRAKNEPGEGNVMVFASSDGELVQPLTGKPQPPTPLDGKSLAFEDAADRRIHLANWLTSPENPYFSRAITNRVWANFFAVGLVEMVDDMRLTNPASNEKLLSAAAKHLVDHKFDLKALMRTILQSKTYQLSSRPSPENAADARFYSHYYPRRMMAEVLLDAISQVTGSQTTFGDYPGGWRAMQLPDSNVNSYFLQTFGRPDRVITCECERTAEPTMVQVLHISNGNTFNQKLQAKGNRLEQLLAANTPDDKIIDEAFLSALSRQPTSEEKAKLLKEFASVDAKEKRAFVEDVYWSLLSSKEFLLNH